MLSAGNTTPPKPSPTINVMLAGIILAAAWTGLAAAEPLDEPLARQAYEVASNWVARGRAPGRTFPIDADNLAAVRVTLRLDGVTLGQATAAYAQPLRVARHRDRNPDGPQHMMDLLRLAVAEALDEVAATLPSRAELEQTASRLALDVQFAATPRALELPGIDRLPGLYTVGVHGLAMRDGGEWAWSFPATAIAANLGMRGQINRLLGELDVPLTRLPKVGKPEGPTLYRLDVIHLVRPTRQSPVMSLYRGDRVLPPVPLAQRELEEFTQQLADRLMDRLREDERLAGTYHPTSDKWEPPTASLVDSALACYALSRYAKLPNLRGEEADRATDVQRRALRTLVRNDMGFVERDDGRVEGLGSRRLAPVAMALLAVLESPDAAMLKPARPMLAGALLGLQQPDGRFRIADEPDSSEATAPMRATACFALVGMYDQTRERVYLEKAKLGLNALWEDLTQDRLVSTLPWLAKAEFDLARLDEPSPHLRRLGEALAKLWDRQVPPPAMTVRAGIPPDTVGGLDLSDELIGEPTWRTAPPLAALAEAARVDGGVAVEDQPQWLVNSSLAARFLKQLAMHTPSTFYVRDPQTALHAMRLALWDNRQTTAATAMALLATAELNHTVTSLALR